MDLARLAGDRAKIELSEPQSPETEAPEPAAPEPAPQAPEPPVTQALAAAPSRSAGGTPHIPPCKPVSYALLFTRLVTTVHACITFYRRLAAGTAAPTPVAAPLQPDPRREKLHEGFQFVTKNLSNRADLLRATTARANELLAADPDQTATVPDLLWDICQELKIPVDLAHLPDKFLPPAPANTEDIDIQDLIRRCATYPPNPQP